MTTLTINVTGMHCGSCEQHIDKALHDVAGVHSSRTSAKTGTCEVTADEGVTVESILAAIAHAGYTGAIA